MTRFDKIHDFRSFTVAVLLVLALAAAPAPVRAQTAPERSGPKHSVREAVNFTVLPLDGEGAPEANASGEAPVPDSAAADKPETPQAPPASAEPVPVPAKAAKAAAADEAPAAPKKAPGSSATPAGNRDGRVTAVGMQSVKGGVGYAIRADRPVTGAKWFALRAADKLVVDLPGKWTVSGPSVHRFDSGPVLHAILGEHPDFLRVVLVLRDAGGPAPALRLESAPGGLVIVVPTR